MSDGSKLDGNMPIAPGWDNERKWKAISILEHLGASEEEMQIIIDEKFGTNHRSIGAIVGDVAGSRHEFNNIKTKEFELLADNCYITDDSVLVIATKQALLNGGTAKHFAESYRNLAKSHLFTKDLDGKTYGAGYGTRFFKWLMTKDGAPYESYGNGAAMRVSPIAWFYDDLDEVERVAEISASVSHNHPEGIKGAKSVAGAILLARMGKDKPSIKKYVEQRYGYNLDFTLDEIRDTYQHSEASQDTVPQAIVAFLEGRNFEDVIRNAVSIGGDSDTISAIASSIAEGFYGIPDHIYERTLQYIPEYLLTIVVDFNETIGAKNTTK